MLAVLKKVREHSDRSWRLQFHFRVNCSFKEISLGLSNYNTNAHSASVSQNSSHWQILTVCVSEHTIYTSGLIAQYGHLHLFRPTD